LRYFDRYCSQIYPAAQVFTQEMVDAWCAQRPTENNNSCLARIAIVFGFVRYLKQRRKTDIAGPLLPKRERRTYMPHAFTVSELERFFYACDNLPATPNRLTTLTLKITAPIFFRLLYSSGMRTNEARLLRVDDVDWERGVLSIRRSKGEAQHYVVLHDTMLTLMRKYDTEIRKFYPNRQYFFPSPKGCYRRDWVCKNFRKLWNRYNTSRATAYDLRHHYATENINQWIGEGFGFESKLVWLSKSMGHSVLESTRYYYSFVPAMADIIEKLSGQDFEDIVPEVDND
jgi:integrase